jgi:crotonobetainyl-CoA:carnitine CoA-transferase CaiB-like acyl-CoA transferase
MTLTAGVAAALFERERTGKGQHVTTSLMRTGMYILGQDITMSLRLGGRCRWVARVKMRATR